METSVQIKAFVGHSFADQDEALINKIIRYIEGCDIQCKTGWKAQNKSVSDKVKERIEACDFFVGIFTKSTELCGAYVKKRIFGNFFKDKAFRSGFYMTSNWVIQESGYALGKGRPVLLMVEKGIYNFPELQGDQEIIPFDRSDLNAALVRLSDILHDMKMKYYQPKPVATMVKPSGSEENPTESSPDKAPKDKKTDGWDELIDAFHAKDIPKMESVYKNKVRETLKPDQQPAWDAIMLKQKYRSGDASALEQLKEYVEKTHNPDAMSELAQCYEFGDKFEDALSLYSRALASQTALDEKVSAMLGIANCHEQLKGQKAAIDYLLTEIGKEPTYTSNEEVFKTLLSLAKKLDDNFLFLLFCEKILSINPVNTSIRFDLALKYSSLGKDALAIFHYRKYLSIIDDAGGLNNIGVSYASAKLPAKAVTFYEKSRDKDETLAMANLANKYLNEGFVKDAEEILKTAEGLHAKGIEIHQNIGIAKQRIKELLEEENKKEKELLADAEKIQRFRANHAQCYCEKPPTALIGVQTNSYEIEKWGTVSLTIDFDKGLISGHSRARIDCSNYFLSSLLLGNTLIAPQKYKLQDVTIEGNFRNLSGQYTLKITDTSEIAGSKSEEVFSASGLFVIKSDLTSIEVWEESKDEKLFKKWALRN